MALLLRQVEVRALTAVDLFLSATGQVEREVDEAAGRLFAVDQDVLLRKVPTPWPYDDGREFVVGLERWRRRTRSRLRTE